MASPPTRPTSTSRLVPRPVLTPSCTSSAPTRSRASSSLSPNTRCTRPRSPS
jgi:hypothetical protein